MLKNIVFSSLLFTSCISVAINFPKGAWNTTPYLPQYGQYHIKIMENNEVKINHDPNRCLYNDFGDIAGCTRMAEIPYTGKIKLYLTSKDTTKKVYKVSNTMYSIITINNEVSSLLEYNKEGRVILSLPLVIKKEAL